MRRIGLLKIVFAGLIFALAVLPSFAAENKKTKSSKKQEKTLKAESITGFQDIKFGLNYNEVKEKLLKKFPAMKETHSADTETDVIYIKDFELGTVKLNLTIIFNKERTFQAFDFRCNPISFTGPFNYVYEYNYKNVEIYNEQLLGILYFKYKQPIYINDHTLRAIYENASRNVVVPIAAWKVNDANVKYAIVNVGEMFRPRPVLSIRVENNGFSDFFDNEFASILKKETESMATTKSRELNKELNLQNSVKKGRNDF